MCVKLKPTELKVLTLKLINIADGKLYLNYSLQVRGFWSRDIPGNIRRANGNWPGVLA